MNTRRARIVLAIGWGFVLLVVLIVVFGEAILYLWEQR